MCINRFALLRYVLIFSFVITLSFITRNFTINYFLACSGFVLLISIQGGLETFKAHNRVYSLRDVGEAYGVKELHSFTYCEIGYNLAIKELERLKAD